MEDEEEEEEEEDEDEEDNEDEDELEEAMDNEAEINIIMRQKGIPIGEEWLNS